MIRSLVRDYFSFDGRLPRGRYWLRSLASAIVASALAGIATLTQPLGLAVFLPLAAFAFVVGLGTWASLVVRRFHDLGRKGWLGLGGLGLSGALSYAGQYGLAPWAASVMAAAACLALFVYLGFVRGARGPNAYGPDPLA